MKQKMSTKDLCQISIFTAIIAVVSQLQIPMPGAVPMTLQTFIIPFAGIVLGAKKGTLATVIYVLLGAVGVPVFAGFTGGLHIIVGATGGFILSFPLMAFFAGKSVEVGAETGKSTKPRELANLYVGLFLGAIVNYICGVLFFMVVMSSDIRTAIVYCVLPFIPTALIKIFFAGLLGQGCKILLKRTGVLD